MRRALRFGIILIPILAGCGGSDGGTFDADADTDAGGGSGGVVGPVGPGRKCDGAPARVRAMGAARQPAGDSGGSGQASDGSADAADGTAQDGTADGGDASTANDSAPGQDAPTDARFDGRAGLRRSGSRMRRQMHERNV